MTFEGEHNFTHNVAGLGGGVYVRDTEFSTKGIFRMEDNRGGALHALGTRYHSEGVSIFSSNWAGNPDSVLSQGGSLRFASCEVYFEGSVTVHNSSAIQGAVHLFYTHAVIVGNSTFTRNRGWVSGALYVGSSSVTFIGDTIFENNFSSQQAVLNLFNGSIETQGNFILANNSIGGGFQAVRSNGTLNGTAIICNNLGGIGGGVRLILSRFFLQGSIVFENNSANLIGGALSAYNSSVVLGTGNVSLSDNSAPQGGGVFLQALSTLIFNPPLQMYARHNMADKGAAIFVEDVISYNFCLPNLNPLFPLQDEVLNCFFFHQYEQK